MKRKLPDSSKYLGLYKRKFEELKGYVVGGHLYDDTERPAELNLLRLSFFLILIFVWACFVWGISDATFFTFVFCLIGFVGVGYLFVRRRRERRRRLFDYYRMRAFYMRLVNRDADVQYGLKLCLTELRNLVQSAEEKKILAELELEIKRRCEHARLINGMTVITNKLARRVGKRYRYRQWSVPTIDDTNVSGGQADDSENQLNDNK